MINVSNYGGQNWLITPSGLAVNQPPPTVSSIKNGCWCSPAWAFVISRGETSNDWSRDTVYINPDVSGPMNWAATQFSIPTPPQSPSWYLAFQVEEWCPFATINSIFDQNELINAGFAVDDWRPTPFSEGYDIITDSIIGNIFDGIFVDVAVRDSDAWLYRVGYHITLLGKIKFLGSPIKPASLGPSCLTRHCANGPPPDCAFADSYGRAGDSNS